MVNQCHFGGKAAQDNFFQGSRHKFRHGSFPDSMIVLVFQYSKPNAATRQLRLQFSTKFYEEELSSIYRHTISGPESSAFVRMSACARVN